MDKLKMRTPDRADENFRKLAALFPNAVTETIVGYNEQGKAIVERAIDKDVLAQEISAQVVDGRQERYQFTWPDKRKSVVLANAPIAKTLRLDRAKSVGRDGTPGGMDSENVYIEGDNLDALKLLQETYLGKVKMIYIDPPYNTGNDFIYEDDFSQPPAEYLGDSGQYDGDGNRLVQNTESNGRFHTDWLNMMYPRLKIARDFLSDDGVIFISVDDHESHNLRKVCDEVFGAINFIADIVWEKMYTSKNDAAAISQSHDYIVLYAKNLISAHLNLLPRTAEMDARYNNQDNDPRGPWKPIPLYGRGERKNGRYPVVSPKTGKEFWPAPDSHWLYRREDTEKLIAENRIYFGKDGNSQPNVKRFLTEVQQGAKARSLWKHNEVGSNDSARRELKELYDNKIVPFNFPKPIALIEQALKIATVKDSIVLDFFSGSATTAHAVMQLNAEDGGRRKFIMVQLPEPCDAKSEAYKAGYKTICEIGEERIRRAGKKIRQETGADIDCGFRVFKVDSSNMRDVYYRPAEYRQDQLEMFAENIKPDRTPEDLLFQVMLDLGVLLSSRIEETVMAGKKVFSVADGYLLACFEDNVTQEAVTEIAKRHPFYAVFRDSGLGSDSLAANFEQIFKTYSPNTERKVL